MGRNPITTAQTPNDVSEPQHGSTQFCTRGGSGDAFICYLQHTRLHKTEKSGKCHTGMYKYLGTFNQQN